MGHSADTIHVVNAEQDPRQPSMDAWQIGLTFSTIQIRVSGPSFPLRSPFHQPTIAEEPGLDLVDNSVPLCTRSKFRRLAAVALAQRVNLISPVSPSAPPHDSKQDVLDLRKYCRCT